MKRLRNIVLSLFLVIPTLIGANDQTDLKPDTAIFKQAQCLATNLYFEARGEPFTGIVGVAQTTINRTKHKNFPNTVCEVVHQKNQFSWTTTKQKISNRKLYDKMYNISVAVMTGNIHNPKFTNTIYFHNTAVTPDWSSRMKRVTQVGNHIFYAHK